MNEWQRRAAAFALSLAAAPCGVRADEPSPTPHKPAPQAQRWEEDYAAYSRAGGRFEGIDRLKFVPLRAGLGSLSLGAEARLRFDSFDEPVFGLGGAEDFSSFQTRLLANADWRVSESLRVFAQVGRYTETGRRPGPRSFDQSQAQLALAFADLSLGDADSGATRLRLGRQEFVTGSGLTFANRETANARLAFDAARATFTKGPITVDAFIGQPVLIDPGAFDGGRNRDETAFAVSVQRRSASGGFDVDGFVYGRRRASSAFVDASGRERRTMAGLRMHGARAPWSYAVSGGIETGSVGVSRIQAWAFASDVSYAWRPSAPISAGLRVDAASGDTRQGDGVVGTFDTFYPALNYFSEIAIFAPSNIWDIHPYGRIQASKRLSVALDVNLISRLRAADGFYRVGGGGLLSPSGPRGLEAAVFSAGATWRPSKHLELRGTVAQAVAGAALRDASARSIHYAMTQVTARY